MITKELVTIIVPTIGRPKYIKSTIESILMQDYKEIEILISDNLTEISTELILGFDLDPRIKIITRDQRHNFSEHMNMCIDDSRGYYLMILSDDDLISTNYVSSMVDLFKHDDVMVALGYQKILNENDLTLNTDLINTNTIDVYDGFDFSFKHFQGKSNLPIYTYLSLLAKKNDVVNIGGFKNYLDGSNADNYLFYSLAFQGKVGVSSSLMGYRIYMASSGLSTPFEKLYLATSAYDKNISSLIWKLVNKPFLVKIHLRILVKISSARMLAYRLIRIYKTKIGVAITVINLARIIIVFLPKNILFGVKNINNYK